MDSDDKKHPSLTEEEMAKLAKEVEEIHNSGIITDQKNDYDSLNSVLSEYLDSYVLIGYNMKGDEVVCHKLNSTRDVRSLASLLEEIAMNNYIRQMVNQGEPGEDEDFEDFEDEDFE